MPASQPVLALFNPHVQPLAGRLVRVLCLFPWFLILPSWAQSREITCYSDVFAPYVVQEGLEIRGIDVDMIAEAGRRAGVSVKFRLLPWVRLERDIALGERSEVECAFAYTQTDARKVYMDFTSVPVKLTELSIFVRRGTFTSFKGVDDLKGTTIGIRRGFKLPPAMQVMRSQGDFLLEEVDRDAQNFEKLARGRISAILSNSEVGRDVIDQIGLTDIVALAPPVQTTPTYLIFNKAKGLSALTPLFDKAFKSMIDDGTYRKIRAQYL
jgi:polar amino acid transport system substrate-binding protein